jgi:methyltransferase (TIGR00027 family)
MSGIEGSGGKASLTAVGAAVFRAAHLVMDDDPKVFEDPFAFALSGAPGLLKEHANTVLTRFVAKLGAEAGPRVFRYLRALTVMRSRYAEDELRLAIERGLMRYVILGAGLDSFAYRHPDLTSSAQVLEVDHPMTQTWKKERLLELGMHQPSNLVFLPLNLKQHSLTDGLTSAGYGPAEPAFVSWLGVTQYLPESVVFRILRQVGSLPDGTEVIFTYVAPRNTLDHESQRLWDICSQSTRERGEPWITFFETTRLIRTMQKLGFSEIQNLAPKEANARYFSGRRDNLSVAGIEHVMRARVS